MKTIWIINHYAIPPSLGGLNRHYYFAKNLIEKGYNVRIFTSSIIHNSDKDMMADCEDKFKEIEVDGVTYTYVKSSPYKGNGLSRIKNMLGFAFDARLIRKQFKDEKPDVIYTSSPDFFTAYAAENLAKKLRIPCIVEIRDLWPLSIVEYMGMSNHNPMILALYQFEKRIYKRATNLIFTQEGGKQYIIDKGWGKDIDLSKIHYINNGIDYDKAVAIDEDTKFSDIDLDNNKFKVVYTGSIRTANNVKAIVDVANIVKDKDSNIEFLIYGDGDERENLIEYCNTNNINNVLFKGKIKKTSIPYLLSKCDLSILVYKQAGTWKYGGSQNKMFDYMAAGKPIISNIKIGYSLFEKYNCGYCIEDSAEIADKIIEISQMDKIEYNKLCDNARNGAKNYDFKILTEQLINIIEEKR